MRASLVTVLLPLAAAHLVPFDTHRKGNAGGSQLFPGSNGLSRLAASVGDLPGGPANATLAARQLYCPGGNVFCGAVNCMPPSATCCAGGRCKLPLFLCAAACVAAQRAAALAGSGSHGLRPADRLEKR